MSCSVAAATCRRSRRSLPLRCCASTSRSSSRVVNVVDLMRLQPDSEHPHGLSDAEFDSLFTQARPIVFAYHGYPWLIHRLAYRRTNHDEPARSRLQGRRNDDDAVRHGDVERPRPLPPRDRRHRPRAGARRPRRPPTPAHAGAAARGTRVHARARRRRSRDPRLDVAVLTDDDPRRQCRLHQPQAEHRRPGRRLAPRRNARRCRRRRGRRTSNRSRRPAVRRADAARRRCRGSARRAARARTAAQSSGRRRDPAAPGRRCRRFRTSPSSTRRSTGRSRRSPPPISYPSDFERSGSSASASTDSRSHGSRSRCRRRASSSATSAAAARSPPCATDGRSTRRWASPRSKACRWRRAPGRSTLAHCSTCSATA